MSAAGRAANLRASAFAPATRPGRPGSSTGGTQALSHDVAPGSCHEGSAPTAGLAVGVRFSGVRTPDGPAALVALICAWITTEVGRQPWVVYGVMRTPEAVTGASGIPGGYATLALVYAMLVVAVVWVLRRLARAPLESVATGGSLGPH